MTVIAIATAIAAPPATAQPDARAEARAAFARAQQAAKARDWRTAIAEYERAYQLSPHVDVLFNIAASYEQLGDRRTAATYYQRYLDGAPTADDRAKVTAKLTALRDHPATITIEAAAGTAIVVDGRPVGPAPLAVELGRGSHQLVAELPSGRATRVIVVEYGEAQTIRLATAVGRGVLVVTSNAPRAIVRVDGREVGVTPWRGEVDAGPHAIVVSAPGYTTDERTVEVPADGTAQIMGSLGRPVGYVEPSPGPRASGHLQLESGTYLGRGYVGGVGYGYRGASQRLEATTSFQYAGAGLGWGLRLRGYALTGPVRPYAVVGVNYGAVSGAFAGGGVLIPTRSDGRVSLEFFVEGGVGVGSVNGNREEFVPIVGGVNLRMGGSGS